MPTAPESYGDSDSDRLSAHAIIIEKILRRVLSGGYLREKSAHQVFGIIQEVASGALHSGQAITFRHFLQTNRPGVASRDLGSEIALALVRRAHVAANEGKDFAIHVATAHQLHGRNAQALLINFAAGTH